jgi:hypothetical protein
LITDTNDGRIRIPFSNAGTAECEIYGIFHVFKNDNLHTSSMLDDKLGAYDKSSMLDAV